MYRIRCYTPHGYPHGYRVYHNRPSFYYELYWNDEFVMCGTFTEVIEYMREKKLSNHAYRNEVPC